MPAERAGYTVTMFLVDVSKSMGNTRIVEQEDSSGEVHEIEMTNLQWALQLVKLKIQEMIFNGRKTDQCGVIIFGSEETNNMVNKGNGGYENVSEYITIGQPNASTLAKIDALEASSTHGDPIDALIVSVETQDKYLGKKKTWTRKIVIVTDGLSPIEVEDWEVTVQKMDQLNIHLSIIGVDFDDEKLPFKEEEKPNMKKVNEQFYDTFTKEMRSGELHTLAYALLETTRPEIKQTRSTLMGTVLRVGDVASRSEEALELVVKTTKCTALARPKAFKKFAVRPRQDEEAMQVEEDDDKTEFAQLGSRTEFYIDRRARERAEGDVDMKEEDDDDEENLLGDDDDDDDDDEGDEGEKKPDYLERVEKEDLVRGFKYGTTYVPCPDGAFPGLSTRKGIDICGFFSAKNFRRELSMGEIQYVWADPALPQQQVALSSIVKAMQAKGSMAIARWVSRDNMDPKMGVLLPHSFENVDCFLWSYMPFADDIRRYAFSSLTELVSKKGEVIKEHPYLPTKEQQHAMDNFVDSMDLMQAGPKDENGVRGPWFDSIYSYNPSIHRVKQAMFHCAIVPDVVTHPLPPPHPELLKYFSPPKRVLKKAEGAIEECKSAFNVKQVPKRVARARKDDHEHAQDEDDGLILLDRQPLPKSQSQMSVLETPSAVDKGKAPAKKAAADDDGSETEPETDEEEILLDKSKKSSESPQKPNTPPASPPPASRRGILPTPAKSGSPEIDEARAFGRIIGNTFPLKDFKKNIAQGDLVTKAVEDMCTVVTEIVMRPFSNRRTGELLECMEELRKTCLEEDEIDAWNSFLRDLKEKCAGKPGNPTFWKKVRDVGRDMSLISVQEAKRLGGESNVSENEAAEFVAS